MIEYLDIKGERIDRDRWVELLADDRYRLVGYVRLGDIRVSTVWLGLNHAWDDGPPLFFETMIFGGEHDQFQERYSTLEEAEEGHLRAVFLAFGDRSR